MMLNNNLRICLQLIHRDMLLLKRTLVSRLIDAASLASMVFIVFGHLMPTLGMPKHLIAPYFLGSFGNLFFSFGYSFAIALMFEVKNRGRLYYLMTLPLSLPWVFIAYIISFIIQVTAITIPTISFGILLLGDAFQTIQSNWMAFFIVYILSALFFALLMITSAIHYRFNWFLDNLWPRRLTPLFAFGCTLFLWQAIYQTKPMVAYLMLANPLVYILEGMRSTIIGGNRFIPGWICAGMLVLFCGLSAFLLSVTVRKRLDPVI